MDSRRPRWPQARIAVAAHGGRRRSPSACLAVWGWEHRRQAPAQPAFGRQRRGGGPARSRRGSSASRSRSRRSSSTRAPTPTRSDPILLHLIEDIAPEQRPVLRLGGDSTDWSWWPVSHVARPPGVRFTLTPNWMDVAHALATAVRAGSSSASTSRLTTARSPPPRPERWSTGSGAARWTRWSWATSPSSTAASAGTGRPAASRSRAARATMTPPPSSATTRASPRSCPTSGWPGPAAARRPGWPSWARSWTPSPACGLVTVHAYPLKHCTKSKVITIPQLLSEQSSHGLAASVAPYVAVAAAHHAPLRVDEMNGISCGGHPRRQRHLRLGAVGARHAVRAGPHRRQPGSTSTPSPARINEILGPAAGSGA